MIAKLGINESIEVIRRGQLAHLGCVTNDGPYVVPINYVFDGQFAYLHSLPGRKVTALRADPRACLQVDEMENAFQWRSAIAYGTYEEINDPGERDKALQKLLDRFPNFTPVESAMSQVEGIPETVIFRIRVEAITGVAEG